MSCHPAAPVSLIEAVRLIGSPTTLTVPARLPVIGRVVALGSRLKSSRKLLIESTPGRMGHVSVEPAVKWKARVAGTTVIESWLNEGLSGAGTVMLLSKNEAATSPRFTTAPGASAPVTVQSDVAEVLASEHTTGTLPRVMFPTSDPWTVRFFTSVTLATANDAVILAISK